MHCTRLPVCHAPDHDAARRSEATLMVKKKIQREARQGEKTVNMWQLPIKKNTASEKESRVFLVMMCQVAHVLICTSVTL